MVRIQCRVSRKRYLGSKQVYKYERMSLHIPRKFHKTVKPLLKQDLDMNVTTKEGSRHHFDPVKTFRHAKNTPIKTGSENPHTVEF